MLNNMGPVNLAGGEIPFYKLEPRPETLFTLMSGLDFFD